ncbi:Nuclear pore complex protein Nup88 [Mizuhopecten yessoensis]|uniref:Nuclear pore complex protein Nup88 n=1 Tax=Mizuhopecten yessoensis TaxID=6573 RepID=A0A210PUU6_MIZYE|nr:Nuclear pore complex protein Nup88 [Mizuhopecten yessoensis]
MAGVDNWRTCLNDQPFCKQLRENNAKDSRQKRCSTSKGLTAVQGGDLYVWDSFASHLVFYNLKNLLPECADRERNQAQILLCSNAPRFDVEFLTFNPSGSLVALWGQSGITVLELPKRWGRYAELEGGKPSITCKSVSIASHFFASHKGAGLQQVLWHPGSESDTHLTFLMSNGILSVYNVQFPDIPTQVIHLDSHGADLSQTTSCISVATALGERTMGFDFGPSIQLSRRASLSQSSLYSQTDSITVWPAYIVKGNGDMLVAYTDLHSGSPVKLPPQGPLLMHPPAEDNYGVDACAVCCLGEAPTVLVIATCEGKLHHCIVLPSSSPEYQGDNDWSTSAGSTGQFEGAPDVSLYVYESVELELTLTMADGDLEEELTCPIRLLKDAVNSDWYHCCHAAGIHTVILPWLSNLQTFCFDDGADLQDLPEQQECIVEHLICTKPLPSSPPSPVLGVGVVREADLGTSLLALTSDIDFVSLPLREFLIAAPVSVRPSMSAPHKSLSRVIDAESHKSASQGALNVITMSCRVRILTELKQQQQQDLGDLEISRTRLHESAQELAIRYDDCQEAHDSILRRSVIDDKQFSF